jgi:hypothetical protein
MQRSMRGVTIWTRRWIKSSCRKKTNWSDCQRHGSLLLSQDLKAVGARSSEGLVMALGKFVVVLAVSLTSAAVSLVGGSNELSAQTKCKSVLECAQQAVEAAARADAETKAVRKDLEGQIGKLQDQMSRRINQCRICFRETEGSDQCQGNRNSCSDWTGIGGPESWTQPFRDDTDNRLGGCTYQWRLECR